MSNNCIVLSTNQKFLWTAFITVDSFLHCNQNRHYDIYILCTSDEIHQKDMNIMLSNLSAKYKNFSLYFHDMKQEIASITRDQLDAIKTTIRGQNWTIEAYFRVFIPQILYGKYKKCLYLDSDLLIVGNIDYLFDLDLGSNFIAAVEHLTISKSYIKTPYDKINGYFNSGVMVLDIEKIIDNKLDKQFFPFIIKNQENIQMVDESVLNGIFISNRYKLPNNYNYFWYYGELNNVSKKNVSIVHYTGSKPWNMRSFWLLSFFDGYLSKLYTYISNNPFYNKKNIKYIPFRDELWVWIQYLETNYKTIKKLKKLLLSVLLFKRKYA